MATVRQKELARRIAGKMRKNEKVIEYKEALDVGYSENTARAITDIKSRKGFKEAFEEAFPDKYLEKKQRQVLESWEIKKIPYGTVKPQEAKTHAKKRGFDVISAYQAFGQTYVCVMAPDPYAIDKGLDKAYKVKGSYAPEKIQNVNPFDGMSDEELAQKEAELEEKERKVREALSDSKQKPKM